MKKFLSNISNEFSKFKLNSKDTLTFPPMLDEKPIGGLAGLYLSIYAKNRDLPNIFYTNKNKDIELKDIENIELESTNIVTHYTMNDSLKCLKSIVDEYISDYNPNHPSAENLLEIKRLIINNQIHPRSLNANIPEDLTYTIPIKNYSYTEEKCINIDYTQFTNKQNLNYHPAYNRENFDFLKEENNLTKEMVIFNLSVEENRMIDLERIKLLSNLEGVFHMNSTSYKIIDVMKTENLSHQQKAKPSLKMKF